MCKSSLNKSLQFSLPRSEQRLVLMPSVLETFSHFRQMHGEPEGGGLLFAKFEFPIIRILSATKPHRTDVRWRTLFIPNRILQRRVVKGHFKEGLHFVGEWHTHPEPDPRPSNLDLRSMRDAFLKSTHELNYFVTIIIGNRPDKLALWVSIHDSKRCQRLVELG